MFAFLEDCFNKATLKRVVFSYIVFFILFSIVNNSSIGNDKIYVITGESGIPDFRLGYSLENTVRVLSSLGNDGRDFFLMLMPFDFLCSIESVWFSLYLTAYILKRINGNKSALDIMFAFSLLCMIFDWCENFCVIAVLMRYPNVPSVIYFLGKIMTMFKYIFTHIKVSMVLILLLMSVRVSFKRRVSA